MTGARTVVRSLLVVALIVAAGAPLAAATPHPAVARIVVQEADGTAYGSGTLVDVREQYGLVATNWHVVRDAVGKIEVLFPGGFRSEARPLKLDEDWDLAALVIWRPSVDPAPLAARAPRPGEPLTICGYGQGRYRALTGRCTEYYAPKIGLPHELVELNVEARQGDSGGPIFNQQGELAGVLFGAGQGTTMGSFGGRVNAFLSTLASDIGVGSRRPPTLSAPEPPPLADERPALVAVRSSRAIEQRSTNEENPALAAEPSHSAPLQATPEPAIASSTQGWASVTTPTDAEAFSPWGANTTSAAEPADVSQPVALTTTHHWLDDLKSLFALIGVAAVLLAVVKSVT